jgi:hypothetical protein
MARDEWQKLPGQSVTYLLICGAILLAFILIAIIPYQKTLADLDSERKGLQAQIERQKIIFPLYRDLLSKMQVRRSTVLPSPERAELERGKVDEISAVLRKMGQRNGLLVIRIVPDAKSITRGAGILMVSALLKGGLSEFRRFLVELGGLPYLRHIEEVRIQSVPGTKEFRLRFWLALKKVREIGR